MLEEEEVDEAEEEAVSVESMGVEGSGGWGHGSSCTDMHATGSRSQRPDSVCVE